MKKTILATALISALMISCNETKEHSKKSETLEVTKEMQHQDSEKMASETHVLDNSWIADIQLDNGNKWAANLETTEGITKMLQQIESSNPRTIEDYQNLASQLNTEKNFVIKECTMKGPSHDNLHIFLHPLIEKIEALKNVSTTTEGTEITQSIKENLTNYGNYFQ